MFSSTIKAAYEKDPALKKGINFLEVFLYQGVWAIWMYRIAHFLYVLKIPVIPRLISQITRILTLIEIHPGARIGKSFFIDHGVGVVIGETTIIGDNVMVHHGVTLGGPGWWAISKNKKRHPTIEDNVILGVGATILGDITIGKNSKIGANALVVKDVPPDSVIVAELGKYIFYNGERVGKPSLEMQPGMWVI